MTTPVPMYDLSPEQFEAYELRQPLIVCVPVQPCFSIGDKSKLEKQIHDSLPDVKPEDIDDIRPSYVWANIGAFRKDPPNTLDGLLGPVVSQRKVKPNDLVMSVFCVMVSLHGGRLARQAASFPSGLIYFDTGESDERAYSTTTASDRPTFRAPVNPEYFVDRDFGKPIEDDDEY